MDDNNVKSARYDINSVKDLEEAFKTAGWKSSKLNIFMLSEESDSVGYPITDEVQVNWSYIAPKPYAENRGRGPTSYTSSTKQVSQLKTGEILVTNQHFDSMGGWAECKIISLPKSVSVSDSNCRFYEYKVLDEDKEDDYSSSLLNILLKNAIRDTDYDESYKRRNFSARSSVLEKLDKAIKCLEKQCNFDTEDNLWYVINYKSGSTRVSQSLPTPDKFSEAYGFRTQNEARHWIDLCNSEEACYASMYRYTGNPSKRQELLDKAKKIGAEKDWFESRIIKEVKGEHK